MLTLISPLGFDSGVGTRFLVLFSFYRHSGGKLFACLPQGLLATMEVQFNVSFLLSIFFPLQ